MTYFVDSNIFLRFLVRENEKATNECARFFELIRTEKVDAVSSHIVLAEIVWTLKSYYKFPREDISKTLSSLLSFSQIHWINDFDSQTSLHYYTTKNIKYIDSLIASLPKIQTQEWVLVSYDREFDKIPIPRKEPSDISLN